MSNMELSRNCCRICVTESEFNISLFGNYCRRTNMIDKILVCLKLVIEESDRLNTICYKCAENIERYYDFIMSVKKFQTKLGEPRQIEGSINRRHVTSYVRQQVIEENIADCTFSFREPYDEEDSRIPKQSTPFFSYFSAPPKVAKKSSELVWKTPREVANTDKRNSQRKMPRPRSKDIFESQSQEIEEENTKSQEWNVSPVSNILKRARDKCFGRSDF